jgi:nucleotide-binding universal stress UspA family protein
MKHLEVASNAASASGIACELMRVEYERPYQAIIDTAKERGCDVIVMASHGRGGISAIVLVVVRGQSNASGGWRG